jgi:putative redox protein
VIAKLAWDGGASGIRFAVETGNVKWKMDSGPDVADPSPVQALLAAAGACSAMDVIEILRKKRLHVTGYEIEVEGDRRTGHPRAFTHIRIVHRLRGTALSERAVEEAIRLSEDKYCTVIASLRPTVTVTSRYEIRSEGEAA